MIVFHLMKVAQKNVFYFTWNALANQNIDFFYKNGRKTSVVEKVLSKPG